MFCLVYDDTLGTIFMMAMFRWTRSETIFYNGIIQIGAGCVEILGSLFVLKIALKYARIRTVILVGIFLFVAFYVVSFSWPGLPPMINGFSTPDQYNCTYDWCSYTSQVYLWQYLIGYVCLLLAFPVGYAPSQNLLSKISNLNAKHQGLFQGLGTSSEYLATLLGPVVVTTVFELQGPRVVWGIALVLLGSALVVHLVLYKRLGKIEEMVENFHSPSATECSIESLHANSTV